MPSVCSAAALSAACFTLGGFAVKVAKPQTSDVARIQAVLHGPSSRKVKYNLTRGSRDGIYSQDGQDIMIKRLLCPMLPKGGFFVESGAVDGERHSNTLGIEMRCSNWTGLLVEPDASNFKQLLTKQRKSYAFNGCLSPEDAVTELQFKSDTGCFGHPGECGHLGGVNASSGQARNTNIITTSVTCAPLHMLLDTIGQKTVDFWSLDIEGAEASVLAVTDFSKFEVGTILIEMDKNEKNNQGIWDVMNREGFKEVGRTKRDRLFVNPAYFEARGAEVPQDVNLSDVGKARSGESTVPDREDRLDMPEKQGMNKRKARRTGRTS